MKMLPYDPKLTEFLYFLTRNYKVMNSNEIAKKFNLEDGRKITDRTVRRWFNYLQTYCFDYYYYLKYENLGLFTIYAIIRDEKDIVKFLNGFPLHDYVTYLFDSRNLKDVLFVRYLVPEKRIKKLKEYLENSKTKGLIKNYQLYYFSTPTIIYSPFHKVIDKQGNLDFSTVNENDYTYFIELLKKTLTKNLKVSLSKHIKRNPLILPILFTQHREHWSSVKIWNDIKNRIGNDIWNYLKKVRKETDPVGIRYVQRTLKQIYGSYRDELLHQVRVEYNPIVLDKYATTILFLDFKSNVFLLDFVKQLSRKSLMTYVYPPYGNFKKYMLFIVTGHKEMQKIMTDVIGKYISKSRTNKILWRSKKKFKEIWGRDLAKFKYEKIFDPLKCEWV